MSPAECRDIAHKGSNTTQTHTPHTTATLTTTEEASPMLPQVVGATLRHGNQPATQQPTV